MLSSNPTEVLPHRAPFLWVTRLIERKDDGSEGTVEYDITEDLEVFKGHFPGNPVFPGVLQIEAGAQACGWVYLYQALKSNEKISVLFVAVDTYKFRKIVVPGMSLEIKVKQLKKMKGLDLWSCEIRDKKDSSMCSSGKFWLRLYIEPVGTAQ